MRPAHRFCARPSKAERRKKIGSPPKAWRSQPLGVNGNWLLEVNEPALAARGGWLARPKVRRRVFQPGSRSRWPAAAATGNSAFFGGGEGERKNH